MSQRRWPALDRRLLAAFALLLLVAFGLIGARPLWDPDEGRYTNVALHMLASGDWVHPMRSDEAGHWTKPPLTYWSIAGSLGTFGLSPGAARLPMALAFLGVVGLLAASARRIGACPLRAALAFGTMFLPAMAAQLVTADMLLALCATLAMAGYLGSRFGDAGRGGIRLLWIGLGLGFLTKGPPALLPLLAALAHEALLPREQRLRLLDPAGLAGFAVLAFGWFGWVTWERPDLLRYFIGSEVVERIAGHGFGRNTGPLGWAKVYLPVLLLGTLPWTPRLVAWVRRLPRPGLGAWRAAAADPARGADVLLALWILLPLLVLCFAASRLPLYALPLFAPLALAVARVDRDAGALSPRAWGLLGLWVAALLGLRATAAALPNEADAQAWADGIEARVDGPVAEVVFVDDEPRYGLHLHLDAEVERVETGLDDARAIADGQDHALARELREREPGIVYVVPAARWPAVRGFVASQGMTARPAGAPLHDRIVFTVEPGQPPAPARPAAGPAPTIRP